MKKVKKTVKKTVKKESRRRVEPKSAGYISRHNPQEYERIMNEINL